jgi:hypothetical protein
MRDTPLVSDDRDAAGLLLPTCDHLGRRLSETGQGQEQEKKFIHAAMEF